MDAQEELIKILTQSITTSINKSIASSLFGRKSRILNNLNYILNECRNKNN